MKRIFFISLMFVELCFSQDKIYNMTVVKDTQWVIFSCPSTNNGDDYPTGLYQCQYPVILYSYWSEELGQFYDLYDFKKEDYRYSGYKFRIKR